MLKRTNALWLIAMLLAVLTVIFGIFLLWTSINLQLNQNREKEALIDVFYQQSSAEEANEPELSNEVVDTPLITGDTIGVMRIPTIDLEAPIGFGVSAEVVNKQVGMYTTTDKFLTVGGNTGFAAHTSFRGGCSYCYFYHLRDVAMGDLIYIDYKDEKTYVFRVIDILNDEAIEADIAYNYKKEDRALITLSTCSDAGRKRDFVVAEFIETN